MMMTGCATEFSYSRQDVMEEYQITTRPEEYLGGDALFRTVILMSAKLVFNTLYM